MNYVAGKTIRTLREKMHLTQAQLAERINVTDKAVSKWENDRGLPDIGIIADLAKNLGVSVAELLTGDVQQNKNRNANLVKSGFYVCPVCGNVIFSVGEGSFSCCGITLPVQIAEKPDASHQITVQNIENEIYVQVLHDMDKTHYISFIAYVCTDSVQIKKFYPEMDCETRFQYNCKGKIFAYCNRHGLFELAWKKTSESS